MAHDHTVHRARADAFQYVWDNAIEPAVSARPGDVVEFTVRDAGDEQIAHDSDASAVARLDFSHVNPVSGPVHVEGAHPGDVLAVDVLEFRPRAWGWTAIIPGFGLLADDFPEPWLHISEVDASAGAVHFARGIRLPYRPFPGTIGVAPAEPGSHSVVPPRRVGGNIDTPHLQPGATLLLPVEVEGALFSVGDTHAAQGDGEVCGTAIETAMDVALRLSVRRDIRLDAPAIEVPAREPGPTERGPQLVLTGVGPDLMAAARDAVRAAIGRLVEAHDLTREEAYAFLSVAADLRIHEVVDAPNWVVGCWVPRDLLERRED